MTTDLSLSIESIHARFGAQALVSGRHLPARELWPCGCEVIDRLAGGGLPKGRITVVQGAPGSGKLTLAMAVLASATRSFAEVVVVDPAPGFDPWLLPSLKAELGTLTVVRTPRDASGEVARVLGRAGVGLLLLLGRIPERQVAMVEHDREQQPASHVPVLPSADRCSDPGDVLSQAQRSQAPDSVAGQIESQPPAARAWLAVEHQGLDTAAKQSLRQGETGHAGPHDEHSASHQSSLWPHYGHQIMATNLWT